MTRSSRIGSGITGPSRPIRRRWNRRGILRGEEDGRGVGEPAAVVVAEVVQVEDDRRPAGAGASHQLQADGMPAVGQQDARAGTGSSTCRTRSRNTLALARAGRTLGPAGGRGHDRDADAADLQVDHLRGPAAPERRSQPPGRAVELEDAQQLVDRGLALVVEDPAGQRAAIPAAGGQQLRAPRGSQTPRRWTDRDSSGSRRTAAGRASSGRLRRGRARRSFAIASRSPGHSASTARQSRAASSWSPRSAARAARLRRVRWP